MISQMKLIFTLLVFIFTIINAEEIPTNYNKYKDIVYKEISITIPNLYVPPIIPSLIEHETCITLTHSKCWNPKAELRTPRELGVGLGQMTKAYRKDGTLRFDTLTEMVKRYPKELKGLDWKTVYTRPDLQVRSVLLLYRDNFKRFNIPNIDYFDRLAFTDAAYNGGYSGVLKDIQLCKMKKNCNQLVWFDNVEKTSSKGNTVLYGNRTATDINRHHVRDVLINNLPKYTKAWEKEKFNILYPIP